MSSLKAILMSRQLTDAEADQIVEGLRHVDIGITEPMGVYDHDSGSLRNPGTFAEQCKELQKLVLVKKPGCMTTAAHKIAFTALVTHCVAAGASQVIEINEALGITKAPGRKDSDGEIVISAAEVDVMREAEREAAGGIPLPPEITPSPRMILFHMRGMRAQVPFLREYNLTRCCTMTAAQAVRSYAPLGDLEKLAGEKEYDSFGLTQNGVIQSMQRIFLDQAARGIASATSVECATAHEVSGPHGQVLNIKGKRRRVNGGRQMMWDMLSLLMEHGGGKTGEQLEACYETSVHNAVKAYDPQSTSVMTAFRKGHEKSHETWRQTPQGVAKFDAPPRAGVPAGAPRGTCDAYNSAAGCPNRCPCPDGKHMCSWSLASGGVCQDTGHNKCGHTAVIAARKRKRETGGDDRRRNGGSPVGSPASSLGTSVASGSISSGSSSRGSSNDPDQKHKDRMADFLAQLGK
jgi:hypothetical protein